MPLCLRAGSNCSILPLLQWRYGTPQYALLLLDSKHPLSPSGTGTIFNLMARNGQPWSLNSVQNVSLSALLCAPLNHPIPQQIKNPVIRSTLRVWTKFRRTFGYAEFTILSPIASNNFFAPSQYDTSFIDWHKRGIISFSDLFKGSRHFKRN